MSDNTGERLLGVPKPDVLKIGVFYIVCEIRRGMTAEITRDMIVDRLGQVTYDRFLCYIMGPYKSFNLNYVLSDEDRRDIDIDDLPGPLRRLFQNKAEIDAAQALLRRVQGSLRVDPGINAFLALDIDIPTEEVDAATQSIEFTRCSNATAFILPFFGHNFGVGEEAGSILEALAETHGDRLIFLHEENVTSAMIRSARVRWDLRIDTYDSEAELVEKLRLFAGGIMHQERRGELAQLE